MPTVSVSSGGPRTRASCAALTLGAWHSRLGCHIEVAKLTWEQAETIFTPFHRQSKAAQAALDRAVALARRGRHEKALAGYQGARDAFDRLGDEGNVGECTLGHAMALAALGRNEEALAGCEEARAIFERLGGEIEVARCALGHSIVLAALGRDEEALPGFEEAKRVLHASAERSRRPRARLTKPKTARPRSPRGGHRRLRGGASRLRAPVTRVPSPVATSAAEWLSLPSGAPKTPSPAMGRRGMCMRASAISLISQRAR